MTTDDIRDLAIRITDALVRDGYVRDCTDTDDPNELHAQDAIAEVLAAHYGVKLDEEDSQ